MVGSFALELYLKALNSQEVAHPIEESDEAWTWFEQHKTKGVIWEQLSDEALKQGHDLLVLYDAIEESIRRELSEVYHNSPVLENIGSVREALGVYATVFVDLRYAYEHGKSIPQRPLPDLLNLVKLVGQFVASKNDRGKFLEKMRLPNKREGTE